MEKNCSTCAFKTARRCKVLNTFIEKDCFAWADTEIAKKRENDCIRYAQTFGSEYTVEVKKMPDDLRSKRSKNREKNLEFREGKTALEVIKIHFKKLYDLGLTDLEIAKELHVTNTTVGIYRRTKSLLPNVKKKTAPVQMETAAYK